MEHLNDVQQLVTAVIGFPCHSIGLWQGFLCLSIAFTAHMAGC